jgi:hypothetical protein
MIDEILIICIVIVICGIICKIIPLRSNEKISLCKNSDEVVYVRTRRIGTKLTKYKTVGKIEKMVCEIENHQRVVRDQTRKDMVNHYVNNIIDRLILLPKPLIGRQIGTIVLAICKEIPTIYDHSTCQVEYLNDLAVFLERAILDNDQEYKNKHLAQSSITSMPEFSHNHLALLYSYLQNNFDISKRTAMSTMCCCGHHAGIYWPMMKAILLGVPEEGRVVRWSDIHFRRVEDVENE